METGDGNRGNQRRKPRLRGKGMLWKPENCEWKKINPLLLIDKKYFLSVYFPWFPFLSLHFCSWFPCLVSTGFRVWFPSLLLKQQGGVSGFPRMVCHEQGTRDLARSWQASRDLNCCCCGRLGRDPAVGVHSFVEAASKDHPQPQYEYELPRRSSNRQTQTVKSTLSSENATARQ